MFVLFPLELFKVWIIADAYFSKMKHGAGVIYRRVGITSARPSGTDWEVVIGVSCVHICMLHIFINSCKI